MRPGMKKLKRQSWSISIIHIYWGFNVNFSRVDQNFFRYTSKHYIKQCFGGEVFTALNIWIVGYETILIDGYQHFRQTSCIYLQGRG